MPIHPPPKKEDVYRNTQASFFEKINPGVKNRTKALKQFQQNKAKSEALNGVIHSATGALNTRNIERGFYQKIEK